MNYMSNQLYTQLLDQRRPSDNDIVYPTNPSVYLPTVEIVY